MKHNGHASAERQARRLRRQHYQMTALEKPLAVIPPEPAAPDVAPVPPHGHKHATSEAEKLVERLHEQLARSQAEFDNYRKRQRREGQQQSDLANQRLVESLLPVLDNFNRAMQNPGSTIEGLLGGIDMVRKQFAEILKQNGLDKIEAAGQPFDPNLHEAVSVESATEHPDNHVTEVFQDGYTLKGRLIRPAMVKVARA